MTAQEIPASEQNPWDAQHIEGALAHLERLQQQIDALRTAIPSVVEPLLMRTTSKAQIFATVKKAALQSTDDLKAFRANWQSEQTQEVLERSRESEKSDGELGMGLEVEKYGWSTS